MFKNPDFQHREDDLKVGYKALVNLIGVINNY